MTDHEYPPDEDVIIVLARRWRVIGIALALGLIAGIAKYLLSPRWYEARLAVVPSQRSIEAPAMSLAAKLPGMDTVSADSKRIEAVLKSYSVADRVIDRFNLDVRYGKEHREHTRDELAQHCRTSVDRKSGVVSLVCEDTDPDFAARMTAYFGEVGNDVFRRVSASSAHEEAKFLETQVIKSQHDVEEASRKLREFQEKHRVVDLPEQAKAVISAMAAIKGELLSKQLELSYISSFASSGESRVMQLRQQIGIMESKLRQLEASQNAQPLRGAHSDSVAKNSKSDFFPDAMKVPELRYELEQLLREQKIAETVFLLITQRYEMAKIEAARDTSTFQILDSPTKPTYPARPKLKKLVILGVAAGLFAAGLWILGPLWWQRKLRMMRLSR